MRGMFIAEAGMPARRRQCIHAKEQDQNTRAAAYPDEADDIPEPARGGAHGEQHGQRAETKGQHQRRTAYGIARGQ